jgi:hypothetical protein
MTAFSRLLMAGGSGFMMSLQTRLNDLELCV